MGMFVLADEGRYTARPSSARIPPLPDDQSGQSISSGNLVGGRSLCDVSARAALTEAEPLGGLRGLRDGFAGAIDARVTR